VQQHRLGGQINNSCVARYCSTYTARYRSTYVDVTVKLTGVISDSPGISPNKQPSNIFLFFFAQRFFFKTETVELGSDGVIEMSQILA